MRLVTVDTVFSSLSETFGMGMYPGRAGVSFHKEASKSARRIILPCGANPDAITRVEMDEGDFRVECLPCSLPGKRRIVMRWTIAVSQGFQSIVSDFDIFCPRSFTISSTMVPSLGRSGDWLILQQIWKK
jgi:hypothetical protein